jgi:tetratricopeptide (TPR) repeat protein
MIFGEAMRNSLHASRLVGLVCLVLYAFTPSRASGQESIIINSDQQFRFAENYFHKGEYYRAISEYERFIHFFPGDERVPLAAFKIGESYFHGERFKEAITAFTLVIETYPDSGYALNSYFRVGDCYLEVKLYDMALATLDNLLRINQDPAVNDEAHYRQGWIYLEKGDWENAQGAFSKVSPENRDRYRLRELSEKMNKKESLKTKNPHAAGLLAILPGAGHAYCERYRDALISFLLNGAMILAAYEAFDHDNEALGGLITFFEIGLYSANIYSAVNSAHKYNVRQKNDLLQYLKSYSTLQASTVTCDGRQGIALTCAIRF